MNPLAAVWCKVSAVVAELVTLRPIDSRTVALKPALKFLSAAASFKSRSRMAGERKNHRSVASPTVRLRQKAQPNEVRAEDPLACRIAFHGRTSGQARTLVGNAEQAGARCLTLYGASVPGFYSRAQGR